MECIGYEPVHPIKTSTFSINRKRVMENYSLFVFYDPYFR